mmetsp:Transcript_18243/g.39370  ORF Transcript_18243/g.39370 Transcript_18243/m.39370 type:complete len:112 (-) Transcript_18243:348-683(-)
MQLHRKRRSLGADGGEWEYLGDIRNGLYSYISYNSQPTFVIPWLDQRSGRFRPIYMGDNWNANGQGGVGNASYLWLSFERSSEGSWKLPYQEQWMQTQIDAEVDLMTWKYE